MRFHKIHRRPKDPRRADQLAGIRINLRRSSSPSVGASGVGLGGVGLHGRPRPVPLAPILVEDDRLPTHGRPSRPTQPLIHHPRPYGSPGLLPDFPAEVDA